MIEIKFTGGPGTIHESIRKYLAQAELVPEDKPAIEHHFVESNRDAMIMHAVTLWKGIPVACTCEWFRYNPARAAKSNCRHMANAKANART